jgi:hypothetical protein
MRLFVTSMAVVLLTSLTASAQPNPGTTSRPTFSPYLNLLNRGNSPALNYLGIVRPQQQMAQQFNQLNQQFQQTTNGLQNSINGIEQGIDPTLPTTGRIVTFGNTGPYFNRHPVTGTGAGAGGGRGYASGFGAGGGGMNRPGGNVGGQNTPSRGGAAQTAQRR